ncbi:MAG: nuclear transport factor 2 family protein [Bacteroidales bacterium]|nr:nuclear transport factor 2 family protein [Bacteroidales bacterium]
MKNKAVLIISTLLITALSVSAQQLSEKKKAKILGELETVLQKNLRTGENLDADKLSESVDDSPNAGHIMNGVFFNSFDTVLQQNRSGMRRLKSLKYEIKNKRITVLSKNTAIAALSGKAIAESTTGQRFTNSFAWTFIYRKSGGQWKVIHSHQSAPR